MWNVFSKFNFMNGLSTQKSLEFQRIGIDKAALDKTVYAFDKDYSCSSVRYFHTLSVAAETYLLCCTN